MVSDDIIRKVATDDSYYYLAWSVLHFFTNNKRKTINDFHLAANEYKVSIEWNALVNIVNALVKNDYLWMNTWGGHQCTSGYTSTELLLLEKTDKEVLAYELNCLCFGFKFIYESRKSNVLHLVGKRKENGCDDGGTCFVCGQYIFTAKHCLNDLYDISIEGFDNSILKNAKVFFPKNQDLDVAMIKLNSNVGKITTVSRANVLDKVLVCGYPKIPGFLNLLTTEEGLISALGTKDPTGTIGEIAGVGEHYLQKDNLMLITAKIRGGNSGGPIFNSIGAFVGITSSTPGYDDSRKEEDIGYGIAIPFQTIDEELIKNGNEIEDYRGFHNN